MADKTPPDPSKASRDATSEAAAVVLEFERRRKKRVARRARRRRREEQRRHHAAMEQMQQSIEVIKWCILSISTVMAIGLLVGLLVLNRVANEAERIKAEVEDIQREAEVIRDRIRHPLETIGGTLGRQLEGRVSEMIGGDE